MEQYLTTVQSELTSRGITDYDQDLLVALWICLLANRNLLVSCTNVESGVEEIAFFFKSVWGLAESTTVINCENSVDHLPEGFVILSHVEKLNLDSQKRLIRLLNHSKLPVIAVTLNKDGVEPDLYRYLANEFWFRQPYDPPVSWNYGNIEPLQNAQATQEALEKVRLMSHEVKMIPDVHRYIYDIVVFVRFHRMVVGGLPTKSVSDVILFVKFLSRIMGYSYVVPTVVQLGAKKILPLRIRLQTKPEQEPSMRWGSDLDLVRQMMSMWDVDSVVEDVLSRVTPPI